MAGLPEEACLQDTDVPLQDIDVPLQGRGIDIFELVQEPCLCLITNLGSLEEPGQGGQGSMVPLLDPAPDPDLLQQGHGVAGAHWHAGQAGSPTA